MIEGPITFESVARLHMSSIPKRQEAGLRAWAAALVGMARDSSDEGRALTITAAAKTAGTSRALIYRAIRAGSLSSFTPYAGANPRITEGELARWLAGRKGRA